MRPPVLETERLILRGPQAGDAEAAVAFFTSTRAEHVGGPHDRPKAWRLFAAMIGHWTLRGFGYWSVTRRGEDRCVGLVGLWRPEGWPENELGWFVWPEAEGRGVAAEAARAARAYAYERLGWRELVSYINPANGRSRRLAERLGAVEDGVATRPNCPPCLVYRHPEPEALR